MLSGNIGMNSSENVTGLSISMIARFVLLASIAGLSLSSCGNDDGVASAVDSEAASPLALENTTWQLVELVALGGHSFIPEDPADYTLSFRPESRLTGKSDCNTFTAQWALEGGSLTFADYRSTRSLCIRGSLHNYYSLYLREVTSAVAEAGGLALETSTPGVRLAFKAAD
jgi:heat shock protein HslJ